MKLELVSGLMLTLLFVGMLTLALNIQLEQAIFKEENDEFHSAVAETVEETKTLIETEFECVCTHKNLMLFRKRK